MTTGIYMIKNLVNGKKYIGQSVDIDTRRRSHFYHLRDGSHRNPYLQKSFDKYGEEAFEFIVLEECPRELLDEKEDFYMKKYNSLVEENGYNLMRVEFKHYTHSKITREKISIANKGKSRSEETRIKISKWHKGRKLSAERVKKMSEQRKGTGLGESNTYSVISDRKAKEIIMFLYENQEWTIKQVAEYFNVSYYIVINLKDNKSYKHILPNIREEVKDLYKCKNPSARTRKKDGELVNFTDKVVSALELVDSGFSQNKVSKQLKISRNTIRKALKQRQANTEIIEEVKKASIS